MLMAVTGADLQPRLNGKPIQMWRSHIIREGEVLSFTGPKSGCRSYLALGGGISVTPLMESKSTNLSSGFGGFEGRALRKGDILASDSPRLHLKAEGKALDRKLIPTYGKNWVLRVLFGPQDDHFTKTGKTTFLNSSFNVTPHSDRTGIRLAGPVIRARAGMEESIISEGVVSGTIQIPGDGQPIIILGETVTGGYRKIATVIGADLPLLGQMKPGDQVNFEEVSMKEAYHAQSQVEEIIRRFKEGL